jgi:hypothetical protein
MNIFRILGSEMLQKTFYRENSEMTKFKMILEPYLTHAIYPKYKTSGDEIFTPCTLIHLLIILQGVPSETP